MGQSTYSIRADENLIHEIAFLGRITGDRNVGDVVSRALSLTADATEKSAAGFVIQIIRQSIGRDQFFYPLNLHHLFQDMKQRNPANTHDCGEILLHATPIVQDHVNAIAATLKTTDLHDVIRFACLFSHRVAQQLQQPGGSCHLAYIDGNDRRFGYVAQTPFNRTMRNQFNRMVHGIQGWFGYAPPPPPVCHTPNRPPAP